MVSFDSPPCDEPPGHLQLKNIIDGLAGKRQKPAVKSKHTK